MTRGTPGHDRAVIKEVYGLERLPHGPMHVGWT